MSSGMLSAAASLGMILLWDVDGGLTQIDKYLYSSEDYIKVNTGPGSIGNFPIIEFILHSDNDMVVNLGSFLMRYTTHHQFQKVTHQLKDNMIHCID